LKDFDISRFENINSERVFKIGGHEFTFRAKIPADAVARYVSATQTTGNFVEVVASADAVILAALDPGQEATWGAVRASDAAEPLNVIDLQEVVDHLFEVTSGRPTVRPSDSSPTPSRPGTSSTADSPSLAAV
jgi:hypothetical protein